VGIVLTVIPRDPWFRETVRYSVQGLLLVPLYCGLLLRPDGRVARALAHPWLRWLGALSYTLYLVHDAALHHLWHGLRGSVPVWLIGGLALVASIMYAELVRRWVERPLARWRAALRPGGST
jgi:peptidoglycan/LPS O-acetylase OafA/YrhL